MLQGNIGRGAQTIVSNFLHGGPRELQTAAIW